MNQQLMAVAERCLRGAETDTMTFPQVVGVLAEPGVESYAIDFRRAVATYYRPSGDSIELPIQEGELPVAASFDPPTIKAAIGEAQQMVPGYTYSGFCRTVTAAGCAGYLVSFSGKRAVYFGRTGETHVELFPQAT